MAPSATAAPLLPGFYTGAEDQTQEHQLLKQIKKNIDRFWSFHLPPRLPVVVVCMSALINLSERPICECA